MSRVKISCFLSFRHSLRKNRSPGLEETSHLTHDEGLKSILYSTRNTYRFHRWFWFLALTTKSNWPLSLLEIYSVHDGRVPGGTTAWDRFYCATLSGGQERAWIGAVSCGCALAEARPLSSYRAEASSGECYTKSRLTILHNPSSPPKVGNTYSLLKKPWMDKSIPLISPSPTLRKNTINTTNELSLIALFQQAETIYEASFI